MTDMNKHSPGPWIDGGPLGFARWITNGAGAQIACVYGSSVTPESDVNTRLIVAAPEMLEALRAVVEDVQISTETWMDSAAGPATVSGEPSAPPITLEVYQQVLAAIAKAEGRS